MAAHRRAHAAHEEEHVNHERWLLTYSDMITLLMVLFIVLFAMSTIDAQKFDELKDSLVGAFGGAPAVLTSNSPQGSTDAINPQAIDLQSNVASAGITSAGQTSTSAQPSQQAIQQAVEQADRAKASQEVQAAQQEVAMLRALAQRMSNALKAAGLGGAAQFSIDSDGLVVTIVTNSVVFGGNSAVLLPAGQRIIDAIAPTLASVPNMLDVSGDTNQLAVSTGAYPSGWELSSARASSVVRYLAGQHGLAERRFTVLGYSDQRPLVPPSDPTSVERNRRVEVTVMSTQPADVRTLLPSVANSN